MQNQVQNNSSANALQSLQSVELFLVSILQIFENLNVKEASTPHDFKFVLGKYLLLKQGITRNSWVFPS